MQQTDRVTNNIYKLHRYLLGLVTHRFYSRDLQVSSESGDASKTWTLGNNMDTSVSLRRQREGQTVRKQICRVIAGYFLYIHDFTGDKAKKCNYIDICKI